MSTYQVKLSFAELSDHSVVSMTDKKYDHIVIIPAYGEEEIESTLVSLNQNRCTQVNWSVLVLINEGSSVGEEIRNINCQAFNELKEQSYHFDLIVIYVFDIPSKWAGVGMARRIAIDQATLLLKHPRGVVINLDADCLVSERYIQGIDQYFKDNPKVELANLHFEHRFIGQTPKDYILIYELHLRYMIAMQRWLKLPFAYHTVGSSFAVRGDAYHQVGGMNKKKAGEDFYFIHKFAKKGTVGKCNKAIVFPSDRISERVPFGTGRAVLQMSSQNELIRTYDVESFKILRTLVNHLPSMYLEGAENLKMDERLFEFLKTVQFEHKLKLLRNNVKSFSAFVKSFFQWFDAFMLMKYLHYIRDHFIANISVIDAVKEYLDLVEHEIIENPSTEILLETMRTIDRENDYDGLNEVMALFPDY